MTEKPATLSLDSSEWRAMLGHNLNRAVEFLQANTQVTPEQVAAFHQHLDRMKALVSAWHLSVPPVAKEAVKEADQSDAPAPVHSNGEAPKPRRGGWPLGKPRKKRNAPGIAQQVQ
jgi:hypothetical protein